MGGAQGVFSPRPIGARQQTIIQGGAPLGGLRLASKRPCLLKINQSFFFPFLVYLLTMP
jgi:hypothetical protein